MLCDALLVIDDPYIVSTSHEKGQDDDLDGSHQRVIKRNYLSYSITIGNLVIVFLSFFMLNLLPIKSTTGLALGQGPLGGHYLYFLLHFAVLRCL